MELPRGVAAVGAAAEALAQVSVGRRRVWRFCPERLHSPLGQHRLTAREAQEAISGASSMPRSAVLAVLLLAASLGSCVQLARPAAPRASASKPRRSKISPKQLTHLLLELRRRAPPAARASGAQRLGRADPRRRLLEPARRSSAAPTLAPPSSSTSTSAGSTARGRARSPSAPTANATRARWQRSRTGWRTRASAFRSPRGARWRRRPRRRSRVLDDGARQHGVELLEGERRGAGALRRARVRAPRAHRGLPAGRAREHGAGLLARRRRRPELFDAVAARARRAARRSSAFALSSIACAFARAGQPAPPSAALATEAQAPGRLAEWNSQALANLAWAFAKAGAPHAALFDAVAAECGGGAHRRSTRRSARAHGVGVCAREPRDRSPTRSPPRRRRARRALVAGSRKHRVGSPPRARGAVALRRDRRREHARTLASTSRSEPQADARQRRGRLRRAATRRRALLDERLVVVVQSRLDELNTQDICSPRGAFRRRAARRQRARTPTVLGFRLLQAPYVGLATRRANSERECKDNDEECEPFAAAQPGPCCGGGRRRCGRPSTRCWRRFASEGQGAAQRRLQRRGGDRPRGRPELARRRQAGGDAGGGRGGRRVGGDARRDARRRGHLVARRARAGGRDAAARGAA